MNETNNEKLLAYWKDVLSQLKKGSDEYLTAYKNMISAKQAYNQELKDLETEYADKVQSVYDTLMCNHHTKLNAMIIFASISFPQ